MSVQAEQLRPRNLRDRLFKPANAVKDRPLAMRNGWPIEPPAQAPAPMAAPPKPDFFQRCVDFFNASVSAGSPQALPDMQLVPTITVNQIIRTVAEQFKLSVADLVSERRTANVVLPRQMAMWLSKTMTTRSYPYIGHRMNGRDHTTVLHGFRKIERLRQDDPEIQAQLDYLASLLRPEPQEGGDGPI
jgi:hypothetical protein